MMMAFLCPHRLVVPVPLSFQLNYCHYHFHHCDHSQYPKQEKNKI